MESGLGIPRINIHRIKRTLDANKKVKPASLIETLVSVTDLKGQLIEYTITDNKATITESGYVEGSEVLIWCWCLRASEGGGVCNQIIKIADEDKMQEYLDAQ
jgi:hypothetical protein